MKRITVVFFIVITALFLMAFLIFPLQSFELRSDGNHINIKHIKKILASYHQKELLTINIHLLVREILKDPWVYSVSIRRIWPDKLFIILHQQKVIAIWNNNALLNKQGALFWVSKEQIPQGLLQLFGQEKDINKIRLTYHALKKEIIKRDFIINQLALTENGDWQLLVNNHVQIELGKVDIVNKFKRFLFLFQKIVKNNESDLLNVDLRYNNGLALKWRHPNEMRKLSLKQ